MQTWKSHFSLKCPERRNGLTVRIHSGEKWTLFQVERDLIQRRTWHFSRAGEVCFRRSAGARIPWRLPPRLQLPEAPKRGEGGVLKRVSQSQGQLLTMISAACLQYMALGETFPSPKTIAHHLSCLTEFFSYACHWKTLTLNHTGKEIADLPPTIRKQHRQGRDDAGFTQTMQKIHPTVFPYLNF